MLQWLIPGELASLIVPLNLCAVEEMAHLLEEVPKFQIEAVAYSNVYPSQKRRQQN